MLTALGEREGKTGSCEIASSGDTSKCPKCHFMRQMTQNLTKSGAEVGLDNAGSLNKMRFYAQSPVDRLEVGERNPPISRTAEYQVGCGATSGCDTPPGGRLAVNTHKRTPTLFLRNAHSVRYNHFIPLSAFGDCHAHHQHVLRHHHQDAVYGYATAPFASSSCGIPRNAGRDFNS